MADASFRYPQGSGPGPYFYNQQNHQPRHIARNGSPVNSSRANYANDTPSPSRSPVSQASSHHPYNMYGHNQVQGHGMMMNGGGGQRGYQSIGMAHKYQHQNHQAQHSQQNHHHQAANVSGVGHQHSYSGTLSQSSPHISHNLHNTNRNNEQLDANGNYTPYKQQQLHYQQDSQQGAAHPHRHCKTLEAVRLLNNAPSETHDETDTEESKEERNRASVTDVIRRQDWDALDFSGQALKAISRPVFQNFTFLRKLFLDHNLLHRLDPAIGHLRLLSYLDISGNSITEIPPEIGMLVSLKQFRLFDNQVTDLPHEIGHLYKLEFLGIEGNPMDHVIKYIAEHGTQAFIEHIRENDLVPPDPYPREWQAYESATSDETLSVLSYNILCDKYATSNQYGYTPINVLLWDRRRQLILHDIIYQDADVVCLQEVDRESFQTYFQYELANKGYKGIFYPKGRAKTMAEAEAKLVDGCAVFYKNEKYICLDKMVVDFGTTAINRPDMKGEHDIFNRVMPRDNIAVVGFLENRMTGARFMIGNAHIYWDPTYADVKLVQVAILMEAIAKKAEEWSRRPACTDKAMYHHSEEDGTAGDASDDVAECGPSLEYSSGPQLPLILCGDFNSDGASGVYELLTQGELSGAHEDLASRKYGNFTRDGMYHPFKLKSAYDKMGELNFTNYTPNFTGVIDYIWYSYNAMDVKGLLGNVDEQYLRRVPGFPNAHFPSDHLALKAEFAVKPQKATKLLDGIGSWRK